MAIRYVGPGGNDGNTGLSWAQRLLTINGAETDNLAGDTVYFGPGVYYGTLNTQQAITTNGSSGQIITWIADVTGENTDGIGGPVSFLCATTNNTKVGDRTHILQDTGTMAYRTFRGFHFELGDDFCVEIYTADNVIFDGCTFTGDWSGSRGDRLLAIRDVAASSTLTIQNCVFGPSRNDGLAIGLSGTGGTGRTVSVNNCIFLPGRKAGGASLYVNDYDVDVNNCFFWGRGLYAIEMDSTLGVTLTVEGCIFFDGATITNTQGTANEDYNYFWNSTKSGTWGGGKRSQDRPPLFAWPNLWVPGSHSSKATVYEGHLFPWSFGVWTERFAGAFMGLPAGHPSEDFHGVDTQVDAKKTIGPTIFSHVNRDDVNFPTSRATSIELPDAMAEQMIVPVRPETVNVSCQVWRENGYTGTNPQMILKSPGVADTVVTDAGAANTWNSINGNITPAAPPYYIIVEFRNNNSKKSARTVRFSDILVDDVP